MPDKSKELAVHTSMFACAVALFLAINAAVLRFGPLKCNAQEFPYHGWTWWTVQDLTHGNLTSNNVVLLGSSLMVAAIAQCDATVKEKRLDLSTYRGAYYLDQQLKKKLGGRYSTINLSAPGQMPSDAYLTIKAALDYGSKPQLVIYGVAPRDFLDGTLVSPSDTEAFKYLSRSVDLQGADLDFFRSPVGKLDWILQRTVGLYRCALDCRILLEKAISAAVLPVVAQEANAASYTLRQDLAQQGTALNIEPGAMMAEVSRPGQGPQNVQQDIVMYQQRYGNADPLSYKTQFRFLKRVAYLCYARQIPLVLVNMPVTILNKRLIKPGLYDRYTSDLATFARENGAQFIDMGSADNFADADFRDTVHLNGFGGKKFVDGLVQAAQSNKRLRQIMVAASNALEERSLATSTPQGM